jgi:hypothetical protein
MNINRYNYEEYFLLYVDNELAADERNEVEAFAAEHPDLAEELNLLQLSVVKPEKHLVFTNKDALMKSSPGAGFINAANYEEYFILYADNELSPPQKIAVEQYVHAHPERQQEFELFKQAKLEPEKIECSFKAALYKKEEKKKPILFRWAMTAAAAVILIAGLFWLNQDGRMSGQRMADDNTTSPKEAKPSDQQLPNNNPDSNGSNIKEQKEQNNSNATPVIDASSIKNTALANTRPVTSAKKQRRRTTEKSPVDEVATTKPLKPIIKPLHSEVEIERRVDIAKARIKDQVEDITLVTNSLPDDVAVNNDNVISFAANDRSENVFLTNIPVDNNVPLRSFLRKASRVINKVTAIKHSNRPGISIGNVEIAIQ